MNFRYKAAALVFISIILLAPAFFITETTEGQPTRAPYQYPQWSTYKYHINRSGSCPYNVADNLGEVLWKKQIAPVMNSSIAIGNDGTLYFGSTDHQLYAVDTNGSVLWTFMTGGDILSSPTIDRNGDIHFGGMDGYLYCIDSEGSLKWKTYLNSSIRSTPLIVESVWICVGTDEGSMFLLKTRDGEVGWEFKTSGAIHSSPSYLYYPGTYYLMDIIFSSRDGFLYCLNINGTMNWKYDLDGATDSTPAVNKHLDIFITSDDKGMHCLNEKGEKKWRYPIWDDGWCSPSTMDDETVLICKSNGEIDCFSDTGGVSWIFNADSGLASSPIVSADNRVLFVSELGNMHCVSEEGELIWRTGVGTRTTSTPAIDKEGNIYTIDNDGMMVKLGKLKRMLPTHPRNLTIEIGDMVMYLNWDEPEFNGNTPILGYNVMRWDDNDTTPVLLTVLNGGDRDLLDNSVMENVRYHYYVIAYNEVGESPASNEVVGRALVTPKTPTEPMNLRYSLEGNIVSLQWSPPWKEGTQPVTGYHLYRYDENGDREKDVVIDGKTEFKDSVPTQGRSYYYTLAAINSVGEGPETVKQRVYVQDEDFVILDDPANAGQETSGGSPDWDAFFCCFLIILIFIGIPIVLIIIISKAIKGSEQKKAPPKNLFNTPQPGTIARRKQLPPVNVEHMTRGLPQSSPPPTWSAPQYPRTTSEMERDRPIIDIAVPEKKETSIQEILKELEAPVDKKVEVDLSLDEREEGSIPVETGREDKGPILIDIEVPEEEIEIEPQLPRFERPEALTAAEKDDFIVERIMELQAMLREGEIDQGMYNTLKRRLLDQLEDG